MSKPVSMTDATVELDRILTGVVLAHHVGFFVWALLKNHWMGLELRGDNGLRRHVFIITAAFFILHILVQANQMAYVFGEDCAVIGKLGAILSFTARYTFWLFNIYRLQSTFGPDKYNLALPKWFFFWSKVVVFVAFFGQVFMALFNVSFISAHEPYFDYCDLIIKIPALMTIAFDFLINLVCALLFYIQMKKIGRRDAKDIDEIATYHYRARKGLILNFIVCLAVALNLVLLSVTDLLFLSSFEKVVVWWCLVQFDDRLDWFYTTLCCSGPKPVSPELPLELGQASADIEDGGDTRVMDMTIISTEQVANEEITA